MVPSKSAPCRQPLFHLPARVDGVKGLGRCSVKAGAFSHLDCAWQLFMFDQFLLSVVSDDVCVVSIELLLQWNAGIARCLSVS